MTEKCACAILRLMAVATMLVGVCLAATVMVSLLSSHFRAVGGAVFVILLGHAAVVAIGFALFRWSPWVARHVVGPESN